LDNSKYSFKNKNFMKIKNKLSKKIIEDENCSINCNDSDKLSINKCNENCLNNENEIKHLSNADILEHKKDYDSCDCPRGFICGLDIK